MCPTTKQHLLINTTKLLTSYVKQGKHQHALKLFAQMSQTISLDPFAYALALKSAAALRRNDDITALHAAAIKANITSSPYVASSLVVSYGKSSSIKDARNMFDQSPHRNAVTWNAIISLYCQSNCVASALELFERMDVAPSASCYNAIIAALVGSSDDGSESKAIEFYRKMVDCGVKPDLVTVLALLPACIGIGALGFVKEIHGFSVRNRIYENLQFGSAVIEAYGRCGGLNNARRFFDEMMERDVVVWSSMVSVYAYHGEADIAVSIFEVMKLNNVRPDAVMFLGVLKACSHSGRADDALKYFDVMTKLYGVEAGIDQYSCLVDVLSRAGRLNEAYKIIQGMPMKATAKAWGALLCACRSYGEVGLAEIAGRALFEIEPNNVRNYVLLASIYAGAGMFQEAEKIRKIMEEKQIKMSSGGSWVVSHKF